MSEAIAMTNGHGLVPSKFTPEQRQMIRDTYAAGCSDSEFAVLMEIAQARNLNPLLRQIYFRKQWDKDKRRDVWIVMSSIDGLRAIAARTGRDAGQDEPEFEYDDKGKLEFARVRVYKQGVPRAYVGIAHWTEYAAFTKEGELTRFWREKPHIMLSKCAEALGLRKAFPEETSGIYIPEEMDRGERETVEASPPSAKPARTASVQVVEVDTKALAGRRVEADATLVEKLKESVVVGAAASPTGVVATAAIPDGPEVPPAGQPGQPLPDGPSKLDQLLAMLDEVRISGGWNSKAHEKMWRGKHAAQIATLARKDQESVEGAINVCGFRKST